MLLGFAPWGDNPGAASRVLTGVYDALVREWRKTLSAHLSRPLPDHLAEKPGERVGDLYSPEELNKIRWGEPVASLEEYLEATRHFQRYVAAWQKDGRDALADEDAKTNVVAYTKAEDAEPNAQGYLRYLRKRHPFFRDVLEPGSRDTGLDVHLNADALRRHAFVVSSTGGGKSELLKVLAHELAATDAGVLVIDPHGELATDVGRFPDFSRDWSGRLVYLDAANRAVRPCLNPLAGLQDDRDRDEAGELADALQELLEDTNTTGAGSSLHMRVMFKNCLRVLLRTRNPDLRGLYRFMNDADNGDLVDLGKRSGNEMLAAYFAHDFNAPERAATKIALRSRLQEIMDGDRLHLFCGVPTVDIDRQLAAGQVVILNLGGLDAKTAEALGRFTIARLFSMAKRRADVPPEERRPVFVIADEAHLYLSRSAGDILTQTRKYGIHLIAAQQRTDQGHPDVQKLLMALTAVKLVGITSQDAASRQAFGRVMAIPPTLLRQLQKHQFALSIDGAEPAIFWPRSDLVGDAGRMPAGLWAEVLQEQHRRYYRKPGATAAPDDGERDTPDASPSRLFPDA